MLVYKNNITLPKDMSKIEELIHSAQQTRKYTSTFYSIHILLFWVLLKKKKNRFSKGQFRIFPSKLSRKLYKLIFSEDAIFNLLVIREATEILQTFLTISEFFHAIQPAKLRDAPTIRKMIIINRFPCRI